MQNNHYETHIMENPLLPFIFHHDMIIRHNDCSNWHENIEILCCTRGEGFIQYDGDCFPFVKGDIFVVNSNCIHATYSDTELHYHCLIIDQTFCDANGVPTSQLVFQKKIRDPELQQLICRISDAFDAYNGQPQGYPVARIRCLILSLLCILARSYIQSSRTPPSSPSTDHIRKVLLYIHQHYNESLTLQEISDFAGISKYHLAREFKACTGKTIVDAVNQIRCTEAKRMIEQGSSVSQAAISCGFENLSYFSRTFKKHFEVLPSFFLKR